MIAPPSTTRLLIDGLVAATGVADPVEAVRLRAAQVIDSYVSMFGEPEEMPLDLITLASVLGIKKSDDAPHYSPDAELAPDGVGGVEMRLNPDQPETRQRFSIGHEITHTFFPDHSTHVWTRSESRHRDLSNPNDYLEMLCDVGAAELVFPRRWFMRDAQGIETAAGILSLADRYKASREATVRRYAELHAAAVAAVFFEWKLKPTQQGRVGRAEQGNLFGISPEEELRTALRLRVNYAIPSTAFAAAGHYVPQAKSVESSGPLYVAASSGQAADGDAVLELGRSRCTYRVHAIPLWTAAEERGPNGENAVAAVIRPLDVKAPPRKKSTPAPGLFD